MIAIVIYVAIILAYAWIRKCDAYDAFIRGAKEGVLVSDKIFPPLLAFIISVNIFTKSGITEALGKWITSTGLPPEIILQMFIRPLSGNSSMVLMTKVFETYGVDSLYGKMASLIQGTSDTTLYVVSFYLGSVAIKDSRYALKGGLIINLLSYLIVIAICFLLFK